MFKQIFSQAELRDKVISQLDSHAGPCMKELAKLYLFPDFIEPHIHWSEEIWAHYSSVPKFKSNNRYPKYDFIYKNIWLDGMHKLDGSWTLAIIEERPINPDDDRLEDRDTFVLICEDYFSWISEKLSSEGKIILHDCQDKLRELGLLYD